jgi:predicted dehydrogenase
VTSRELRIGVVGFGYWGPNLVRNFMSAPRAKVVRVAEPLAARRQVVATQYPHVECVEDAAALIAAPDLDAIVIATPISTHHPLAKAALEAGKHVLVEKPLTASVAHAEELIAVAAAKSRVLMVDHTFVYTSAVRKIREVIESGHLGRILYMDSVRINLGLFQSDFNVIWDLAPHDLTIMDFVIAQPMNATPRWVSALGAAHYGQHENLAYVTVGFDGGLLAHFHVNWTAPVKTRRTIIAGTERMLVWDDTSPVEPIKIYESSVNVKQLDKEAAYSLNVQYRSGDIVSPKLDGKEALSMMARAFVDSCLDGTPNHSDAASGLRTVRILDAAQQSMLSNGARVSL